MVVCLSEVESETTFQANEINSTSEGTEPSLFVNHRVTNEETMPTSVNSSLNDLFTCEQHSGSSGMIKPVTEDVLKKCIKCSRTAGCVNHENQTSVILEVSNGIDSSRSDQMTDKEDIAELDTKLEEIERFSVSDIKFFYRPLSEKTSIMKQCFTLIGKCIFR
ncbi:hypothetical protein AVEN_32470-1 [Araneus ventricosus]|uniref:Uncharacterized protein n=1 Tax=Araneus ventricosus TaxID=182803 RepID=A0A4Y2ERE8_ARAVE|nr:hypothetical protein AVEN_32470-1 [Araneus ventricosus]